MPYKSDVYDTEEWEGDDGDESDDGYIPCPYCGETMLEDAEHCPACNRWITSEDLPNKGHPWWIIAVVVILVAVMILSVLPI